jgi:adenylosuccinate synthase
MNRPRRDIQNSSADHLPAATRSGKNRQAIQIVDLGFGDSGKGTMVDYLVRRREADLVIRFNGGPQAGHNVVLPDGRHHTFAQFGSGSFVPGVKSLLSRFMLIEPYAMLNEAAHLNSIGVADVMARTFIDERCLVITPPHQIANRIRERARGEHAHGTCGMGFGECTADSLSHPELDLRAAYLSDRKLARPKLQAAFAFKREDLAHLRSFAAPDELKLLEDPTWIETALDVYGEVASRAKIVPADTANEMIRESTCSVFEGAQGVLLDERFGFHPHTTWSKTTFTNADELLAECRADVESERIGVMRTYMTRHGAGPFASFPAEVQNQLIERHNKDDGWQGNFRRGELDFPLLRHAIEACGKIDELAITHMDRLHLLPPMACDAYEIDGKFCQRVCLPGDFEPATMETLGRKLDIARRRNCHLTTHDATGFIREIESALQLPVTYRSNGNTYLNKSCGRSTI